MRNSIIVNGMSTFNLKIVGMILMVVDNFHEMFFPFGVPDWLDWFGRPVATIFFFTSVVGFSHTHSKRIYMMRLYLCMMLMTFLDLFLSISIHYAEIGPINNIFRDLFIGKLFMMGIDQFKSFGLNRKFKALLLGLFLWLMPFIFTILSSISSISSLPNIVTSGALGFLPAIGTPENGFLVLLVPLLYVSKDNLLNRGFSCDNYILCIARGHIVAYDFGRCAYLVL